MSVGKDRCHFSTQFDKSAMANEVSSNSSLPSHQTPESSTSGATKSTAVSMNLQMAMDAINRQDYQVALDALNRAIIDANQVQLAECFALRGFARLKLNQFEHAEDDCSQSIQRRGHDPETLTWRAAARAERQNWVGAFEDLDAAWQADPGRSSVYEKTIQTYLPAAEKTFETRLKTQSRMPQSYCNRGYVYFWARDFENAKIDFEASIHADENFAPAYVGLARLKLLDAEYTDAIRLCSQAMQLSSEIDELALAVRAEAYSQNGQLNLAIEDAVRLREKVGDRLEGLLKCAQLRSRLGDLSGAIEDLNLAARQNPDLPLVLSLRGDVLTEMRNYEMALRDYIRFLKQVPSDERVWLRLGELHLKVGNMEDARNAFDKALEIDEICSAAYVGRCKVMLEMHNHAQGLIESERALRLDSRNPESYILRGKIFHFQGRWVQAEAELDKAASLTTDRNLQGEIAYLRGVSKYEADEAHVAIEHFKEASRLRPTHAGTHVWRAATSAKLEDWPDTIANLQRAIRLRPSAAQQYRKLGAPVAHTAIKHFEKQMREGKMTADVVRNRGRAYQFLGETDEAIADYTVALDRESEDFDTMIARAHLHATKGKHEEAVQELSKVIRKDPENHQAHFTRAIALIDGRQYERALQDVNRAIELAPAEPRYHVLRGDLKLYNNSVPGAIEDYSQAIVLDPVDHLAFRKRGSCYLKLQQYLYAIADLTRSAELFPGLAETHVLRGQAYLKNEQLDQANIDFEQALKIDPRLVRAFVGRANYLAQILRHEEALILLSKAMQRFQADDRCVAELLMMRGKIFYQMGRFPPAMMDFSGVIELRREDKFSVAAARCARAVVLVQHGELVRAKKEFDRVLKKFPDHPLANTASKWLADGNGPRPQILLPPETMIRPTRPPVILNKVIEVGATDEKWNGQPPFDLWIVRTNKPREYGPVTKMMLDDWVRQGRIDGTTRLLRCGWEKWRKARRVYTELENESGKRKRKKRSPKKPS